MESNTRPLRESSFELLRIIAMVMIIFHHFAVHSGFEWNASSLPASYFWCNFISMGGQVGVNIFVLISGYFLAGGKSQLFNVKKVFRLWGQVFFYSAAIYIAFIITGTKGNILQVFFPITSSAWWFASTYFVLFLIHPFLNKLMACLDKRSYQNLLVLLVTCWGIIPTLTGSQYEGNNLTWFITLYAISGYVRLYGFNPKVTPKHYAILCGIFAALAYLFSVVYTIFGTRWGLSLTTYYYGQVKLPILLVSLTLFMAFATLKMDYHKWINIIASATFGVYLIHDHDLVRPFLWLHVFKNAQYQNSSMLIPYSGAVAAIVYAGCTLMDLLRQQTIEKAYMKLVNTYADSWLKPWERVCEFFKQIIFGK